MIDDIYELGIAKITEVRIGHSENSQDKRLYCDLLLDSGVERQNVPFYGPTVDLSTKKLHGVHFPPIQDQMVGYLFVGGHISNPIVCFSIPFDWGQGENRNDFQTGLEEIEDIDDCALFHRTGSKIVFKKDGSIISEVNISDTEKSKIDQNADGEIFITTEAGDTISVDKDSVITIEQSTGAKAEIDTDGNVTITPAANKELSLGHSAFEKIIKGESFQTFFNAHVHTSAAPGSPTTAPTIPMGAAQLSQKSKVGS